MSVCRPGVPSGLRKRSLSPSLPLRMRHRGSSTEFNAPGPSIRAGQGVPPEPPWARPPKPSSLGWNWSLGKRAHVTEVLSWGHWLRDGAWGAGSNQSRTHAPAARLRATAISADPLVAANARRVSPRHVGSCLKLKAPPLDLKGSIYMRIYIYRFRQGLGFAV